MRHVLMPWLALIAGPSLVAAAPPTAELHARPGDHAALASAIDATLARWSFNGVVLVRRARDRPIVRTFGVADASANRASAPDTLYQAGSFSKWIASVVVLRLVDQGKLSLTAPIRTWLPDYRVDTGSSVTLHHLLSHTSGIPNDIAAALGKDANVSRFATLSMPEAVKLYASGDPVFAPGARFDYAHSNWLLVQAIVEKVTGRPYRDEVRAVLTAPLKLRDSGIMPSDFMVLPLAARGYSTLTPSPVAVPRERTTPFPPIVSAMGGYYSSAPDMVRLLDAVYDTRLLSPASRAALWRVNVPTDHYAYGGRVFTVEIGGVAHRMARNNNSNGAYKTYELRVDDGTTILLFNNSKVDQQQLNDMGDALLATIYAGRAVSVR